MSAVGKVAMMEHLTLYSALSLRDFCAKFRVAFHLPEFHFDAENKTEWGLTELNDVEYNVSRPYETDTLREWDDTMPSGCNCAIALVLLRSHKQPTHEWALEHLVTPVARCLASEFRTTVHYHRTWLGPGQNVARKIQFKPVVA